MNLKLFVLVNFATSEKIFKWDVENLEEVYCKNSRSKYVEIHNLGKNQIDEKEAKKYLKKGRKKLAIWPWEYADSFEGECIEEVCTKSEVDGESYRGVFLSTEVLAGFKILTVAVPNVYFIRNKIGVF